MKKLAVIFVTAAFLINAMAPTLAYAATYLQGTEVNANTLIRDAYVQVTYRDHNGQEKTERGWIDVVGDTSFTIRSGHWTKKTIAYDKVLSVIMSEESAILKQMSDVNQLIRDMELPEVVIMSREQIDASKITKGWYAHIAYTSDKKKKNATGKITDRDSDRIVIQKREEFWKNWKIAYNEMDTLAVAKHQRDIEGWMVMRLLQEGNAKVRVRVPSIKKKWMVGKVVKMTQDTLVILRGRSFYQVSRSSISNLEVNIGQYRNTEKGAAIGLGIGVGILALSAWDVHKADDESRAWAEFVFILVAVPAAVLTTLTGTIIGAMDKSDKWVKVSPQSLNLSLAPTSGKELRAALTFNF